MIMRQENVMNDKIQLSVVIPTKNRAAMLRTVLESIERQPADPDVYEVLVIDNGSTDETSSVAENFSGKIKNFRYFYDARPGLHVGRNKGLLESKGELVGYLDDDVILFPNWINAVIDAFEDKEVVRLGGSVIPYNMKILSKEFRKKYEIVRGSFHFLYCISCFWQTGISEQDNRVCRAGSDMGFGGNSVYRKSILLKCRGFHPDGMPKHLLMYRGDGETYVEHFILGHNMKELYCAQASVYHMIDEKRVDDSYIDYMHFRNGISAMYTRLRADGLKGGMIYFWRTFRETISDRKINKRIQGELYLLLYYIFYKRIRHWVHKENYF